MINRFVLLNEQHVNYLHKNDLRIIFTLVTTQEVGNKLLLLCPMLLSGNDVNAML